MEENAAQPDSGDVPAGEHAVTDPMAQLYRRHSPTVYAYLLSRTRNPEEAEDLVGEAFLIACRKEEKVLEARSPGAWLIGVARNLARNRGRRSGREQPLGWEPEARAPSPDRRLERAWEKARTLQAIDQLRRRRAEALRLRYLAELDYPAIARILHTTVAGAKMTVSRARDDLRAVLGREEQEDAQR